MMVAVFQMILEPGRWFSNSLYSDLGCVCSDVLCQSVNSVCRHTGSKDYSIFAENSVQFLAPLILLLASIGAYIRRGLVLDVVVMFIAGIVGFLLRRSG